MQWVKLRLSPAFVSAEVLRIAIKQQWKLKKKKTSSNEKPPLWLKLKNTLPLEQST